MPAARAPARNTKRTATPSSPSARPKAATSAKTAQRAASMMRNATLPSAPGPGRGSAVLGITPFLWFDGNFEQAARFYVSLFPRSRIESTNPLGGSFVLAGQRFMGLNGGPQYKFTPAVSFFVVCRDQKEVDRLWAALEKGGTPSRCGWIDDQFGLTWQIVPEALLRLTGDKDPRKAAAVFDAMLRMVKLDARGLQAAYDAA